MKDAKKPQKKIYARYMGNAVCALSILFVVSALCKIDFDFGQIADWRMFLFVCAAGIVLKTVTVYLSGSAWCFWLEFFSGKHCNRREALQVYAKANIGKYLPGNVMHYVERNLFAGKLKLSQKQIAAATASEIASLVLAAFLIGSAMAFSQMQQALAVAVQQIPDFFEGIQEMFHSGNVIFRASAAGAVILLTAALVLAVRRYCTSRKSFSAWLAKMRSSGQYQVKGFLKTFLASFAVYAAVLAMLGLILVLLYWYWAGRPLAGQALTVAAGYIIAWVLGFVVPGAPGGIGVREMALTLLLSPVMGRDTIAVLSVLHRMITVIGDFAAYLLREKL